MALNHQQYGPRDARAVQELGLSTAHAKRINSLETKVDSLESKITSHLSLVTVELKNLSVQRTSSTSKALVAPSCDTCGSIMHLSSLCPNTPEEVSAVFQGRPNHDLKWNPYSNTYNEGWKANPNFRWSNGDNNNNFKGSTSRAMVPQEQYSRDDDKLGQILKGIQVMNDNISKNEVRSEARFASIESKMEQTKTRTNNLSSYVTQLSNNISDQQAKNLGTMPSNTVINPKSVNAICLRSGKKVGPIQDLSDDEEVDEEIEVENPPKRSESSKEMKLLKKESTKEHESKESKKQPEKSTHGTLSNEGKEELLETFRKVEVNIPLLELIKKIPKYAKFLKELCTNKRKFKPNERVQLPSSVSALFKPQLPIKCQDPGSFTIHCTVGKHFNGKALCDLGASVNLMPLAVFNRLNLGETRPTTVTLLFADKSISYPKGIVEDVLVKVDKFIFPADFIVLDCEVDWNIPIILGQPFLATARTLIDVEKGEITMRVNGEKVIFNMNQALKFPDDSAHCNCIDVIDSIVQEELINSLTKDPLEALLIGETSSIDGKVEAYTEVMSIEAFPYRKAKTFEPLDVTSALSSPLKPSVDEPPVLELKTLPSHLKYAYLGNSTTLLVIVSFKLSMLQEEKLLRVLRHHKKAIGWSIADIKGISPSICMHKILLEDGHRPSIEH
ncbi:uncharacterized protein LOC114727232 [Neltuma alba]|uniref:uncharacterized protein LOC114727232 n=1 Tax=Neltuma alba TaxID=207710 RepID=UPI0010A50BE2|nr:uncharacterized protein LOC114727232 [Prosopis alba]